MNSKHIRILGTRGIPANHGGFETFAERLSLHLVESGWNVSVYCQLDNGQRIKIDHWNGVERIHIPVRRSGALGTIEFDLKSTLHTLRHNNLVLTLGYNTAIFCLLYRLKGITNLINMDGIEWRRSKWRKYEQAWLYLNERLGCWLGNHLIADHPEIKLHLTTRVPAEKITMIPYGADKVTEANNNLLLRFGLEPRRYALVIARPEPENSILEIVRAYSSKPRGYSLVVLGAYQPSDNSYHRKVMDAASKEVLFIGPVYDKNIVEALRYYCRLYVHGHTVGGTNPSLVEALGAGSPVMAHDNPFNRWVSGPGAKYFRDERQCEAFFDTLLENEEELQKMAQSSRLCHKENFTWGRVLHAYEQLLIRFDAK